MRSSIDPLTGKAADNKRRLVFNEQTMSYVFVAKGEKLIRDPLDPGRVSVGRKLLFDPLHARYVVAGRKLAFDPLKGKFITLQKGEKLCYDPLACKFLVVRRKRCP